MDGLEHAAMSPSATNSLVPARRSLEPAGVNDGKILVEAELGNSRLHHKDSSSAGVPMSKINHDSTLSHRFGSRGQ